MSARATGRRLRRGRPARRACLAIAFAAAWLAGGAGTAAAATPTPVQEHGYIPMADGAKLGYTVDLPAAKGRFPVALVYDGYCEDVGALACNDPQSAQALLDAGYAVLGVSIRGTSCSTGDFDAFTAQEWRDGAATIEWAARRSWSNGHVGMFGDSFPGITQLGVAGQRPQHLDAIAPFQVTSDPYRDVAYPGGIQNTGFGAFWGGFDQPFNSYRSGFTQAVNAGDPGCVLSQADHLQEEPVHNIALQGLVHPYDDAWWRARRPGAHADRIKIPTFGCYTWQDDEVSSRASSFYAGLDPKRTWVVASNGYHGMCELNTPQVTDQLVAFFDRFVQGKHNGFERTPHLQVWHETTTDAGGNNVPSWVSGFGPDVSPPVRPLSLYFRSNGELALTAPGQAGKPDRYAYPGPVLGSEEGIVFGQGNLLWNAPDPPGASLSYTTPPLSGDAEFLGSGSANVWLRSTAPDTDLQITLTEVRPDGQEQYVGRGWLRASHRALDRGRSTTLAPYHTHQEADARDLPSGRPTRMRIQLFPFDHVFRKGSSIRLWIDAPTGATGGWMLDFNKTPAVNSVYADAKHPSALVLGHLLGGRAEKPAQKCGTVLNEPCRASRAPVPAGKMTVPGDETVEVRIGGPKLRVSRRGRVAVPLRCPRAEASPPCRGRLGLRTAHKVRFRGGKRHRVRLGSARFRLDAGERERLEFALSPKLRRLLAHHREARRARAVARVRDGAGNRARVARKVRLRVRR